MPTITDWLMVGITVIYVGATIAIYKSNKDALKASEKQVDASIAQVGILKEQIKTSTNLQLVDRRIDLLKNLECENAFIEHEPMLDILFPDRVTELEKDIVRIRKSRESILHSFFCVARNVKLNAYTSEHFEKVSRINVTIGEIQNYISPIKNPANEKANSVGQQYLPLQESEQMEKEAIQLTKDIQAKKEEMFGLARQFIKDSISNIDEFMRY